MSTCFCCEQHLGHEPVPEVQLCALAEWAKGPLRDLLVGEEKERQLEMKMDMYMDENECAIEDGDDEMEWELMSHATSEGWSMVGSEENFDTV